MIENREEWLADTLVTLADTLVADYDVVEFLSMLTDRVAELVDASEVGLMLAGPQGSLRVMAATTERMRMVDLFELQSNEGPCLDTYQSGLPILNFSLAAPDAAVRWPVFTPMAREAGFDTVHALPMGLRQHVIGAANIFHSSPTTISEHDVHLAQALVDAATIGLLQERAVQQGAVVAEQLQHALNSRVVIEQAKGVVAEGAGVDMDTAFDWIRSFARTSQQKLVGVAEAVVNRTLSVETVRTQVTGAESRAGREPGSRFRP